MTHASQWATVNLHCFCCRWRSHRCWQHEATATDDDEAVVDIFDTYLQRIVFFVFLPMNTSSSSLFPNIRWFFLFLLQNQTCRSRVFWWSCFSKLSLVQDFGNHRPSSEHFEYSRLLWRDISFSVRISFPTMFTNCRNV